MADHSSSPFTGLDKALVRSTKLPPAPDTEHTADQADTPASTPPSQKHRTNERSNERTDERTIQRTNERAKVRHSFDVYQDQLLQLSDVQADIYRRTGRKPKIGDLVQMALDAYIERYNERTNGRTNERTVD